MPPKRPGRPARRGRSIRPRAKCEPERAFSWIEHVSLARVLIRLGHSPDPDDAFMVWALAAEKIDTRGFEFEHVLRDIQTLNEWALDGKLETTAISLHAYPYVQDRYAVLPHGASMGSGYGPVVASREPLTRERLLAAEIAVPGRMTTAFLVLRLYLGGEF